MHYGLDIGGTKIEIALFNNHYEVIANKRVATPTDDYDAFINTIARLIEETDKEQGSKGSVGIGLPGVLSEDTGLLLTSNVPCANGKPLKQDLEVKLKRPVAIENDCRCFAFSEASGGAADQYSRVFGAILGTGAGGGFCLNKEIYSGARRVSGEWGHMPVSAALQQKYQLPIWSCSCGLSGCIEHYIAGPGVARLYRFYGGDDISTPEVIKRYRNNEETAVKTFDTFIDMTAAALANLVMTFDPDAIVFGGGLSKVPELYQQLPSAMTPYLFKDQAPPAILAPAFGDSSGVRGAAILGAAA